MVVSMSNKTTKPGDGKKEQGFLLTTVSNNNTTRHQGTLQGSGLSQSDKVKREDSCGKETWSIKIFLN